MPFSMKSYEQIYNDLEAFVRYASKNRITDFNVGSVIRSILEAAAFNDYELYLQLAQLKELNNLSGLYGDDVDERAAEYGLTRLPATPSLARLRFYLPDITKVSTSLTTAVVAGATTSTVVVEDGTGLPSSGYILIERDSNRREKVYFTSRSGTTLTIASSGGWENSSGSTQDKPWYDHSVGASVILSTLDGDIPIPAGTFVSASYTVSRPYEVRFATNTGIVFYDGDVETSMVTATSLGSGTSQNVPAGAITGIVTSLSNNSVSVINDLATSNAAEIETDAQLKARIVRTIQGRIGGTGIAIEDAALNTTAVINNGAVTCRLAKLVESIDGSEAPVLYVHDGNSTASLDGFYAVNDYKGSASPPVVLIKNAKSGQKRGRVNNWPLYANPKLYVSYSSGSDDGYGTTGVGSGSTLQDTSKSWNTDVFKDKYLIDNNGYASKISGNTSNTITVQTAPQAGISSGAYTVIDTASPTTAFSCNLASGEVQLDTALSAQQWLVCWSDPADSSSVAFQYYSGLIAEIQKVLSGDPSDPINYPGVASFGLVPLVKPPTVVSVDVTVSITPEGGIQETVEMQELVRKAVQAYVSSLNIGEAFILSEAIARCQQVPGVFDTQFVRPTANVPLLPNELFRVNGDVVVQ